MPKKSAHTYLEDGWYRYSNLTMVIFTLVVGGMIAMTVFMSSAAFSGLYGDTIGSFMGDNNEFDNILFSIILTIILTPPLMVYFYSWKFRKHQKDFVCTKKQFSHCITDIEKFLKNQEYNYNEIKNQYTSKYYRQFKLEALELTLVVHWFGFIDVLILSLEPIKGVHKLEIDSLKGMLGEVMKSNKCEVFLLE
jgi:multidrug efflux pump subunit AcrB